MVPCRGRHNRATQGARREELSAWEAECGSVGAAADPHGFTASSAVTTFPLTGTNTLPSWPAGKGGGPGYGRVTQLILYGVFTSGSVEEGGSVLLVCGGLLRLAEGGVGETKRDLENW